MLDILVVKSDTALTIFGAPMIDSSAHDLLGPEDHQFHDLPGAWGRNVYSSNI